MVVAPFEPADEKVGQGWAGENISTWIDTAQTEAVDRGNQEVGGAWSTLRRRGCSSATGDATHALPGAPHEIYL